MKHGIGTLHMREYDDYITKSFYDPISFTNELRIYKMNLSYVPKLISYSYFPPNIKIQKIKNCFKLHEKSFSFKKK